MIEIKVQDLPITHREYFGIMEHYFERSVNPDDFCEDLPIRKIGICKLWQHSDFFLDTDIDWKWEYEGEFDKIRLVIDFYYPREEFEEREMHSLAFTIDAPCCGTFANIDTFYHGINPGYGEDDDNMTEELVVKLKEYFSKAESVDVYASYYSDDDKIELG